MKIWDSVYLCQAIWIRHFPNLMCVYTLQLQIMIFVFWMPFEHQHLNTGKVKVCYSDVSVIQMFVIQIPLTSKCWHIIFNPFLTLHMRRESFFRNQQISKLLLTRLSVSISYSTFLSTVTFSTFSTLSVIRGLLERRPNFSTGFEASIFGKLLLSVDVLSPKSTLSKSAKGKTSICCGSETSGSKEKFNYSWDLKSDFS